MSRPDPIGADRRAREASRRLPDDAACAICGVTNPEALKTIGRSVLERHEPGGRANHMHPRVVLCLTHHRIETVRQLANGVDLEAAADRTWLERDVSILLGNGLFLKTAGETLIEHARRLETHVEQLDQQSPQWRTWPGQP